MAVPTTLYPFYPPVGVGLYPQLAILLTTIGLFFFSWFIVYEVTIGAEKIGNKQRRNLFKELLLALVASFFLGWGTLFMLLWTGVYV